MDVSRIKTRQERAWGLPTVTITGCAKDTRIILIDFYDTAQDLSAEELNNLIAIAKQVGAKYLILTHDDADRLYGSKERYIWDDFGKVWLAMDGAASTAFAIQCHTWITRTVILGTE